MNLPKKYKIGIPACFMYPDLERTVFGAKSLSYIENDFAKYVGKKGIIPILIPDLDHNLLFDLLSEMDGFVFQGGADIAPETYGEKPLLKDKWLGDSYRDQYELKIMDFAIKHDKPVLAICRGMQLMNVYFGGTMYQDIQMQVPNAIQHRDAKLYDKLNHELSIVPGTILDQIYSGVKNPFVNTVHHQAVREVGKDLEVLATCPDDGIVEAVGYKKNVPGKVMGVQWHPEFSATLKEKVIKADKLFDVFLSHIKKELQ